jgi:AraC-like DNA-binding protein
VIGPLLLLYVKRSLDIKGSAREWIHFVLPALYFLYMCLDYVQSADYKYNSYVNSFHPDWPLLDVTLRIPDDPLRIKRHLNAITALQILFYEGAALYLINGAAGKKGEKLFSAQDETIRSLRNMVSHLLVIIVIFVAVKLSFEGDLGDHFIGVYFGIFTLLTTFRVMNDSAYFEGNATFIDITASSKYSKSSLTDARKEEILQAIIDEFERKEYHTGNLASLSDLSKRIGESHHHVSQVINERLGKNFYELLAHYRIEKARQILTADKQGKVTIEELSEIVGYNSKTAFNNAFRKLSGMTPSEYRRSVNS